MYPPQGVFKGIHFQYLDIRDPQDKLVVGVALDVREHGVDWLGW
jgi:hypothetical protein